MLQLVQAFRYEHLHESQLKNFFFKNVFENIKIANSFHWLVHLEKENNMNPPDIKERYNNLYNDFMDKLANDYTEYFYNI